MNYIRNLLVRQLLWMAQSDPSSILPPATADPTLLRMDTMTAQLFDTELFLEPYDEDDYRLDATAPQWHAVLGMLERHGNTFRLIPATGGEAIPIHPRCHSRMTIQNNGLPVVLLYDRDNPCSLDQILVSEEDYHLSDPFPSCYDRAYMLLEYLALDPAQQQMVFRFLTREEDASAVFDDLCQVSLAACRSADGLTAAWTASAGFHDRRIMLDLIGFSSGQLQKDLWVLCVLLTVRTLICRFGEAGGSVVLDGLVASEICCRNPALIESIERSLPPEKADTFAQLLLSVDSDSMEIADFAKIRFWLFALLEARFSLSEPVLEAFCHRQLSHPLTAGMLRSLRSSMFSSNADTLRSSIETLYPDHYAADRSGLPAALAVIRIHEMGYKPEPIQEEAQRLLLEGSNETETLLGIAMMDVFLQFRSEHIRSHREPVVLTREAEVTENVRLWLCEPGNIFYPHVCALAQQLYLSCAVPADAFAQAQVLNAASIAWNERLCPARVEMLLSTLPMGMSLHRSEALDRMRRVLQKRFDQAIMAEETAELLIPLFRCCAVLGGWEKDSLQLRFQLLLKKVDSSRTGTSREDREYMRRLSCDILEYLFGSSDEGDGIGFRFLYETSVPIPASERNVLKENPKPVITDNSLAMGLLSYFRNILLNTAASLESAEDLFRRCTLNVPEPYLITDWFYALCILGLSEEAQDFYLAHKAILDRPWVYLPDSDGLSVERPYHAASCFWNGMTRREKGLELAAGMGHDVAQWSLAKQCSIRISQQLPQNAPSRNQVLRFFQIQYSPRKNRMMNYWMTHYDDASVTRAALSDPDNHSTILLFGYCGNKEMVLTAVKASPAHVCYAAKALLKDDTVAQAVLLQSCQYLHLLFAPVTENREVIKQLILHQNIPVVPNRTKQWVRDDKELMLASMGVYPQYFEMVSDRLRRDREVVLAALNGAIMRTRGSYWLRHILRHTPCHLRKDPDVIRCMQLRCPDYGTQEETEFPPEDLREVWE